MWDEVAHHAESHASIIIHLPNGKKERSFDQISFPPFPHAMLLVCKALVNSHPTLHGYMGVNTSGILHKRVPQLLARDPGSPLDQFFCVSSSNLSSLDISTHVSAYHTTWPVHETAPRDDVCISKS